MTLLAASGPGPGEGADRMRIASPMTPPRRPPGQSRQLIRRQRTAGGQCEYTAVRGTRRGPARISPGSKNRAKFSSARHHRAGRDRGPGPGRARLRAAVSPFGHSGALLAQVPHFRRYFVPFCSRTCAICHRVLSPGENKPGPLPGAPGEGGRAAGAVSPGTAAAHGNRLGRGASRAVGGGGRPGGAGCFPDGRNQPAVRDEKLVRSPDREQPSTDREAAACIACRWDRAAAPRRSRWSWAA